MTFEAVSISAACYLTLQNKNHYKFAAYLLQSSHMRPVILLMPLKYENHFRNVVVCKAMKNINPKPWVLLSENTICSSLQAPLYKCLL